MRRSQILCIAVLACSQKPRPAPPAAPSGVTAHAGDGQVTILWDAVDGALGYRLYYGESGLSSHTDVGDVTSWTQAGLTNGHEISFAVSALGTGGESALSATVKATPQANPPLSVSSVTPDDATGVPRNTAVVVKFNKPAQGLSGTSALLSDDNFATSIGGVWGSSDAGATWTFTPSSLLHASATYKLRLTTTVTGVGDGLPLAAEFTSAGFTTEAPLTATIAPTGTVGFLRPQITVTFSRPVAAASVTAGCPGGSITLAAGATCVPMAVNVAGNVATLTPAADLSPATAYAVSVATTVTDTDGVPLDAAAGGGFTTAHAVDLLGSDFQHVSLAWALPSDVMESRVYVKPAGAGSYTTYTSVTAPAASANIGPLAPGKSWDVKVTTFSGGAESAGAQLTSISTDFAGTAEEWASGEVATGEAGGKLAFTWSDSEFFAAYLGSLSSANGDALWIAFDTDSGVDANGEVQTMTAAGGPQIIWPFNADYVVELKNGDANLRTVATSSWAALAGARVKQTSAASEIRFPLSAIGSPAAVRIAVAAVGTNAGYVFDLAPAHLGNQVPTLAYLASVTQSFVGDFSAPFDTSVSAATLSTAPALVLFQLSATPAGPLQIAGSVAPLSYDLTKSLYQLHQADIGLYDGRFNLGGQTGNLFFKFYDSGSPEPAFASGGVDRIVGLTGSAQSVPQIAWSTVWDSTHSFSITFDPIGGSPTQIQGGVSELGNWTTSSTAVPGAAVTFGSYDFTASPLAFKAWYAGSSAYEGGTDHHLDDDVIGSCTLSWGAGDSTNF